MALHVSSESIQNPSFFLKIPTWSHQYPCNISLTSLFMSIELIILQTWQNLLWNFLASRSPFEKSKVVGLRWSPDTHIIYLFLVPEISQMFSQG